MEKSTVRKIMRSAAIIICCLAVNVLGRYVASRFNLPVWLDMIGTCIAAYFVGTAGGIAVGAAGNLLFGFINPAAMPYAITGTVVAVVLGFCVRRGYFEELSKAAISSFWIGMLSVLVSTPINLLLYKGYSGNMWGDALFDMLDWNGIPRAFCAIADEAIVEIVDKQLCVLLAFAFIHIVMRRKRKEAPKAARASALMLAALLLTSALCGRLQTVSAESADGVSAERTSDGISDNFSAEIYNSSTGTMSSEANVIAETADGYIWIGSYAGLTRYDGKEFEFIREGGIAGVTCMLTDSRGRLWIGTNDSGIARYENGSFTFFTEEDGLPVNSIRSFAEKEDGGIYVGTTDRICFVDGEDNVRTVSNDITYVISMECCGDMLVGVGNNGMLFAMDSGENPVKLDSALEKLFCNCVKLTSYGLLLGASGKEVYVLDTEGGSVGISRQFESAIADVISMEEDTEGRVWLCAEAGLGYFDGAGAFHQKFYENFDSSFEWIHVDYQGNIWVASSRYGVLKLSQSRFVDMFAMAGVPGLVVNAVVPYQGHFYCGTDNGLVILDRDGGGQQKNGLTEMLEGIRIRCLMVDSKDRLWICSYSDNGLICYDSDGGVEIYNTERKQMTSDRARCAVELRDGTIAAGTADGINFIRDGRVVGTITSKDGLANSQILSLLEGEDGVLYAGSDGGGLYAISEQRITGVYTTKDGLSSNVILRIVPYGGGYLIVTSNSLCYMKDGITVLKNFPYFNNYDISIDGNTAYVLSSAGIYVVDAAELCAGNELRYRRYSASEGLVSGLIANSWNYLDSDGTLYFCCNSGITGFYGSHGNLEVDYRYGITSVLCDGSEIECADGKYLLPANARKVVIAASVRNYALSDAKVRFYIEGIDDVAQIHSYKELEPVQISNLPAGSYKIHFQIMDVSGDNVLQEQSYTLFKEMQVWEHAWYKIYLAVVCVEIIVFATWTVIIMINNSKRKEQLERLRKELEEKVSEQTEEIRLQQIQTVTALSDAVDAKDRYTSGHSKRVAEYARMLAARMGKSTEEQEEIYRAGLLHDVGKIRIPEVVINKPGKLTPEEFELIKVHPVTGYHILKGISGGRMIAQAAKSHHERYDGSGYPNGLQGENIPEVARIIGVADAYDAMASNRSYRSALPQETVRSEIEKGRGIQFDPAIADIMLEMIDGDRGYGMKQTDELQKTILVAGDGPSNRKMTGLIVRDEPMYRVISSSELENVLEIISGNRVDLILLDDSIPGIDVFEALSRIMEAGEVPVVLMTADKNIATIQRAAELGVDDYLTKPFLPMTIKEVVHSILNG